MDTLEILNSFGHDVVDALNDGEVSPFIDSFGALMIVVAQDEDEAPIAASVNYDREKKVWRLDYQAQESMRVGNA